jgi:hypothetical protein
MKPLLCFAALAALTICGQALATGGLAEVTIIDRDTGMSLTAYYHRGEYWVAGTPGARYAIEIRNRTGGRLLAVTSVDGVNVLSGATAGWGQTGYVFDPGESYQITGWRKSDAEVAAFTFTAAPNSYAERTGRPQNVGVIGVAVFRERPPPRAWVAPRTWAPPPESRFEESAGTGVLPPNTATAPIAGPAPPADIARAQSAPSASAAVASAGVAAAAVGVPRAADPAAKLGTGHGEREYSYVAYTDFQRLQDEPNEVVRIRYDSLENLVAMGIVREPRRVAPNVNPFPASPVRGYVPDPPG